MFDLSSVTPLPEATSPQLQQSAQATLAKLNPSPAYITRGLLEHGARGRILGFYHLTNGKELGLIFILSEPARFDTQKSLWTNDQR